MASNFFSKTLRRLTTLIQTKQGSFQRHNADYVKPGTLEKERAGAAENERINAFNDPTNCIQDLINKHPEVRGIAVDIGSGAGWFSSKLSPQFSRVIAIEPSAAVVGIAKTLYPQNQFPNIEWNVGFAEDFLSTILPDQPVLFITSVVLSHLRDKEVAAICAAVNAKAKAGSILSFNECWGEEWHQQMWHVRTKEWWQQQLSNWELDFFGPSIQDIPGRHRGIHGVKIM